MKQNINDIAQSLLKASGNNIDDAIDALNKIYAPTKKLESSREYGPIIVDIKDAYKKYKIGSQRVEALKGVNLEVREGEFVALTGTSGSGKSTLLQLIGGLDKPSQGQVLVDSQNIASLSDRKLSRFRNKTIGFVFQFFYLQPFLDLETNIEVPAMFARVKPANRHQFSNEMISAVGLSDRTKHLPKELSGGQMQRAAIARALMNKPKILLADEPTGNLDSDNAKAIFQLFEQLRNDFGTTIIVVTHDAKLAGRADRVVKLSDGVIS